DGDPAIGDQHLAGPARGDSGRGEDLLEALGGHQPSCSSVAPAPLPESLNGKSGSVIGSPPSSARREATSTSRGGISSRLVSPKRSRNSNPVPYRNGRPGASERPSSTMNRRCRRVRMV